MAEKFIGNQVSIMSSDGCTSLIEVNGVDMSKASEIIYRHKAGEPPELTIKFYTGEMQLNSVCRVKVENGDAAILAEVSKFTESQQKERGGDSDT